MLRRYHGDCKDKRNSWRALSRRGVCHLLGRRPELSSYYFSWKENKSLWRNHSIIQSNKKICQATSKAPPSTQTSCWDSKESDIWAYTRRSRVKQIPVCYSIMKSTSNLFIAPQNNVSIFLLSSFVGSTEQRRFFVAHSFPKGCTKGLCFVSH